MVMSYPSPWWHHLPLGPHTTPCSPWVTPFPHAGGEWRLKYERAVREIDFTKKRLQQELEDKLEVEQQGKRQLERRVSGGLRGPPGGVAGGWAVAACLELHIGSVWPRQWGRSGFPEP